MEARRDLAVLMGGFATTQMLYVAARLGLADHLARGPLTVAELAAESGCRAAPLSRVLRALSAFGVFKLEAGKVSNTPMSEAYDPGERTRSERSRCCTAKSTITPCQSCCRR